MAGSKTCFFAGVLLGACVAARTQPNLWVSRGPGGGGAFYAPAWSPYQPSECFVSCDMGGLYRTTDGGCSWSLVNNSQIVASGQGCQVQFTSDPHILYALDFTGDSPAPAKSMDGGITWARLASDPTGGAAYTIFADPSRTDRLLVTDYNILYFSGDGGTTWNARYSDANGCYVAGAYFDGNSIYVGTNAGVLVSTTGGSSFSLASLGGIPAAQAMVSFAGAKEGGTLRFVCVTLGSGDVYPGVTGGDYGNYQGVYTLDWGQASWVSHTSGILASDYPFFAGMARNNASVMYVAGGSDASGPSIYKSSNAGGTWSRVFLTASNQNIYTGWSGAGGDRGWGYGEYALGFAVSPVNPNKAVLTDLGFAHVTGDGGTWWHQAYVNPAYENPPDQATPKGRSYLGNGLENTSCWYLTWSDANRIFASFTDIQGSRSTDAGLTWSFNYTGQTLNTMYHCVRHSNGTLYAATSSVHDLYQSSHLQDAGIDGGTGRVLYSADNGATWQTLHDFGAPVIWVALDPNNANRLYASVIRHLPAGTGGIWVSSTIQNGGSSAWTKLADPTRTEGHPYDVAVLNDGNLVCTYSGRRDTSGAFTSSSGVFISTNGGTTWTDRSVNPGMVYWTKDVVVDPHDATQNTWYVCVFGPWGTGIPHDVGGVYRTTNRGVAWARIYPAVAQDGLRVESCAVSPTNANEMFATTETEGLWFTSNLTDASPTFTRVVSYAFQHPLRVFYNAYASNELWVASFGYGMDLGVIGASRSPEVSSDAAHALRAAKNGSNVDITFQDTGAAHYNLYVSNAAGTNPFRVSSSLTGKKQCALAGLSSQGAGMLKLSGYGLESGLTGSANVLFFVVSGDGGAYTEGPLGFGTLGEEVTADGYCSR